jgi:hypothetical protein
LAVSSPRDAAPWQYRAQLVLVDVDGPSTVEVSWHLRRGLTGQPDSSSSAVALACASWRCDLRARLQAELTSMNNEEEE